MDAIRDVRKQFKRNHDLWEAKEDELPIIGTIASQFNDPGTNHLFSALMNCLVKRVNAPFEVAAAQPEHSSEKLFVIPPK